VTNPIYRTAAWRVARKRCLARDGGICQLRLKGCAITATAADHIIDIADGGPPYALENLQAACASCNTAKRNQTIAARARNARYQRRQW
jgi:5-methylcytosine-specific restriction endonuclease McrA